MGHASNQSPSQAWIVGCAFALAVCLSFAGRSPREFVLAARALGLTTPRLILRHVLPNVLSLRLATGGSISAGVILAEAAWSYVVLGDAGAVSLGRSIANAYPFMELAWWMSAAPIAALFIVTLTFMLLFEATDGR